MSAASNVQESGDGTVGNESAVPVTTVASIDADRLVRNLRMIRRLAAGADVMAVVKADAYGHGVKNIVPILRAHGVERYAVATAAEGAALRQMGIEGEVLVMGAVLPEALEACDRHRLSVAVSSVEEIAGIERAARSGGTFPVHVNVDTGMGRLGVRPEDTGDVVARLAAIGGIRVQAVWSHFATADQPESPVVEAQWKRFRKVVRQLRSRASIPEIHIANSGGVLYHQHSIDLPCNLVRAGIALYGYAPDPGVGPDDRLEPVMDVTSRVVRVRTVARGTPVSYGHTWRAPRETRLATIGAGYGDGYRRALSNRAQVRISDSLYPVVGNVCMDMFVVDIGPPEEIANGPPVAVGDPALLFGARGPTASDHAAWAGTIPYEILCGISPRVPRVVSPPD